MATKSRMVQSRKATDTMFQGRVSTTTGDAASHLVMFLSTDCMYKLRDICSRKIYCGILILHNSFRQGRTAFLVNSLLREQSRLLHHREQLLPYGKVIQLETVTDNLLVLETALRVLRIPSQEILFFRSNAAAGRKI